MPQGDEISLQEKVEIHKSQSGWYITGRTKRFELSNMRISTPFSTPLRNMRHMGTREEGECFHFTLRFPKHITEILERSKTSLGFLYARQFDVLTFQLQCWWSKETETVDNTNLTPNYIHIGALFLMSRWKIQFIMRVAFLDCSVGNLR